VRSGSPPTCSTPILPLFDSGQAGGLIYYVMPHVEGESLRQRLEREKELPIEEALTLATSVAGALDYAHRHGVIHRDIKPENILFQDDQAVVADFGIALALSAAAGSRLTETGLRLLPAEPQVYVAPRLAPEAAGQCAGRRSCSSPTSSTTIRRRCHRMDAGSPTYPTSRGGSRCTCGRSRDRAAGGRCPSTAAASRCGRRADLIVVLN